MTEHLKTEAELVQAIYQAHDQLHKGDAAAAHETLHAAIGIDNAQRHAEASSFVDLRQFEHAFRTASRKNNVKAAYVSVKPDGRLIVGGDQELCAALQQLVNR